MTDPRHLPDDRTMRERMLAGELYLADDPELHAAAARAHALQEAYNATPEAQTDRRHSLLSELVGAAGLGEDVTLRSPLFVDYGTNLHLGDRVFANFGLVALDVVAITIGADTQIGPNVQLLTATHPIEPGPRRDKWEAGKPITIGANVWLGGGVIVCPGVSIGDDTIVGAGAVVTRDLPEGVVAVGNPARVVRRIGDGSATP